MFSVSLDVELFNVAVALIGLFTDGKGPEGKRQSVCVSLLRSHQGSTGRGHIVQCIH